MKRNSPPPPAETAMPPSTTAAAPLWQRLLLRRLKFLGWLLALLVVVLGGSYVFAPQWLVRANTARQALAAHVEKHAVAAGDTTWSYYAGGDGPAIVLLHGFDADKTVWLDVAAQLTAHFHLLIPDLPGWGESSRSVAADYSIEAQAERLHTFVLAIGVRDFVLVGHGTGAAVAAVYAAEYPQAVRELALLDAYGLHTTHSAFSDAAVGKQLFGYDDRASLARANALLYTRPPPLHGRLADVRIRRNQADRAFIEDALRRLRQPAQQLVVQDRLSSLDMPVLGLWCHDDTVIDRSALDSLRNGLTHAATISTSTINGCKHLPMLEKPVETAQILTGFALSH
jgi:abhydrolase domain-containing protein 6